MGVFNKVPNNSLIKYFAKSSRGGILDLKLFIIYTVTIATPPKFDINDINLINKNESYVIYLLYLKYILQIILEVNNNNGIYLLVFIVDKPV